MRSVYLATFDSRGQIQALAMIFVASGEACVYDDTWRPY